MIDNDTPRDASRETPRTDAMTDSNVVVQFQGGRTVYDVDIVIADFARALELELSAKTAECERLRAIILGAMKRASAYGMVVLPQDLAAALKVTL